MYYNSSPPQESAMNLLISPFNPDQMPYFNNSDSNYESNPSEYSPNYSQYSQLSHHNEVLDYNNNEAQAFDLQQQNRFFDMTGMSPVAMPASVSMSTLYNRSPSPSSDSVRFAWKIRSCQGHYIFVLTRFFFSSIIEASQ